MRGAVGGEDCGDAVGGDDKVAARGDAAARVAGGYDTGEEEGASASGEG